MMFGLLLAEIQEGLKARFFAHGSDGDDGVFTAAEDFDVVLARQRIRD
jgi:hypothetical protein